MCAWCKALSKQQLKMQRLKFISQPKDRFKLVGMIRCIKYCINLWCQQFCSLEQVEQYDLAHTVHHTGLQPSLRDIILSTIDHHIVFSVKSTMSPEAIQEKQPWAVNSSTGTATCCLCSLLLGQTLTDPMSYSLAGKSNFSKVSNLRKVKHALLCV